MNARQRRDAERFLARFQAGELPGAEVHWLEGGGWTIKHGGFICVVSANSARLVRLRSK